MLAEVVDRAGHGYQRWAELVAQAGSRHHPIRLAGRIEQADRLTGEVLAAGLRGGKGVPETIAEHPRLFVTFTAPSLGRLHTRKAQGRLVLPCHPYQQGARCPQGNRAGCWHRHDEDDPGLGRPRCAGWSASPTPSASPRPAAHRRRAADRGRRQSKEVAAGAGHTSVAFTLDRYGHLFPEADTALRGRLDGLVRG